MQKRIYWHKLDNAGKIFPAISKVDRSNVFRLSFYMHEEVNVAALSEAVNLTLSRFQIFKTELKNGLFWHYLAENNKPFIIEEEHSIVCRHFKFNENNGYMFKIYYLANKITLETFHALTDGFGALQFLKSIVYRYLEILGYNLKHDDLILSELPFSNKENEESFVENYKEGAKKSFRENKAYRLKADTFKDDWQLYFKVSIDTNEFIKLVKEKYNCTVTQYLTALFAYSVLNEGPNINKSKKPVKIFVPVNLRRYFDSKTLRNFSLYITTSYDTKSTLSFEEVLDETKSMFNEYLNKDFLTKRISSLVKIEKNIFVRFIPLFVKNLVLKLGYRFIGESIMTTSLSNIGVVQMPDDMIPYVKDIDFVNSGPTINTGIISYNNKTNIVFNSELKDISVIRKFVYHMRDDGLDITIDTNYKEEYDEVL